MGKIPMILEIELTVDQAEDKIGVRKESCGDPRNGSPRLDLFVLDGLRDDRSRESMGEAVHTLYVTSCIPLPQPHRIRRFLTFSSNGLRWMKGRFRP